MMGARGETLAWAIHRLTGLAVAAGVAIHLADGLRRPPVALDAQTVWSANPWYLVLAVTAVVHAALGLRRLWSRAGMLRGRQALLGWLARLQRWSGGLLALALPFHFGVLALALAAPPVFDRLSALTEGRLRETVAAELVLVAAFHLAGGLRIIVLEAAASTRFQKTMAALAAGFAAAAAAGWLVRPW